MKTISLSLNKNAHYVIRGYWEPQCRRQAKIDNIRNIEYIRSHAGTVVPKWFKEDNASQWKSGKFDPRSLRNS